MKNKILMVLSVAGLIAGLVSAYIYGIQKKPLPPAFNPASNPYEKGIYANGVIESYQKNGANINIYPEVSGTITQVLVSEGDTVRKGAPLLRLDASVQKAVAEQQRSQAEAAQSLLEELKSLPRKENLEIAKAQVEAAGAVMKNSQDQRDKQKRSFELDPRSVSRDTLDSAENAVATAAANLEVVKKQFELIKAGAWIYEIQNQERQYNALEKAYIASRALLDRFTVNAPADGIVLSINATVGSYISPQGTYGTYTQGALPVLVMGSAEPQMGVRCYIDEILLHRLPEGPRMKAQMSIRGTDMKIPLEFVRIQPYVTPKIQLSSQRTERVDVRVLPVIFRFGRPANMLLYPGQLVDVYIGEK
jgi:HlyD family secretion protein